MSRFEAAICRSAPWRSVTGRVVLPWALQGFEPAGRVLEIGAGSGAMADQVLQRHPSGAVTATDYDPAMVDAIRTRLARFGERAVVEQADANALPFSDGSFDVVLSWVMLHHTMEWERALAEAIRVVRSGGHVVGYDLLPNPVLGLLHAGHDSHVRIMRLRDLRDRVSSLPVDQAVITPSRSRLLVRFTLRRG